MTEIEFTEHEKSVLIVLAHHNTIRIDLIAYYTHLPIHIIRRILDKFKDIQLIYNISKENYRLTEAGLKYFNSLEEKNEL